MFRITNESLVDGIDHPVEQFQRHLADQYRAFVGQFNHVVISAAEIFMAMLVGAPIGVGEWVRANFLPALVGNILGGLIFETLLQYVQAQYHEPDADDAATV